MKSRNIIGSRRTERGVSLLIVLVLLLVMTLLGLAILRGTMMEERMTANMYERSLAFQSAESALRAGEAIASATPVAPASGCNAAGVCAPPNPTDADRWLNSFLHWMGHCAGNRRGNSCAAPVCLFRRIHGGGAELAGLRPASADAQPVHGTQLPRHRPQHRPIARP
jgi:Tfp pilus assembly protein PilX